VLNPPESPSTDGSPSQTPPRPHVDGSHCGRGGHHPTHRRRPATRTSVRWLIHKARGPGVAGGLRLVLAVRNVQRCVSLALARICLDRCVWSGIDSTGIKTRKNASPIRVCVQNSRPVNNLLFDSLRLCARWGGSSPCSAGRTWSCWRVRHPLLHSEAPGLQVGPAVLMPGPPGVLLRECCSDVAPSRLFRERPGHRPRSCSCCVWSNSGKRMHAIAK
jgi:hypothetical protein